MNIILKLIAGLLISFVTVILAAIIFICTIIGTTDDWEFDEYDEYN